MSRTLESVSTMDLKTRIEFVELYYSNRKSPAAALRAYKTAHDLRIDPFNVRTIQRLVQRFEETGSVCDKPKSGRPSLEEERQPIIEDELEVLKQENEFGVASTRIVSSVCGIPKSSVHRILRGKCELYPYKLQRTQQLSNRDKQQRMDFANFILSDPVLLESILWTDESYFSLSGSVCKHNCVIWASEKPKETLAHDMHAPKVCVWFGFSAQYSLTPFFFESTITGENYKDMLEKHVVPQIRRQRRLTSTVFQQDGAPPHFSLVARNFISSIFPDKRVISRGFPQNWPAHSPDITPLDFYFWPTLKSRVYFNFHPANLQELRQRIENVIRV